MNILLTGPFGNLGGYVLAELLRQGHTVRCFDLDTEESQRLLQYQRHTFEDIVQEIAALLGWKRAFVPLARPFARKSILKLSPYLRNE